MNYTNREEVKKWFEQNGDTGWHTLIDIAYDNKPDQVVIIEVFEKICCPGSALHRGR